MAWVEEIGDSQALRRCIRDLVALSALPATWQSYDPHQIAESVAAALIAMLDAEFVYIALPGRREEPAIEIMRDRRRTLRFESNFARNKLREWLAQRTPDQKSMANPFGRGMLRIASAPIGFGSAIVVAGALRTDFPTESQRVLLRVGADEATVALERWQAESDQRRFVSLVDSSSDFIAFASLDGTPQYINTAGLQFVGLAAMEDARGMNVLDFLSQTDQARARDKIWPVVMRTGHWVGELSLRHFETGASMPFLADWFRIDDPRSGEPMNIATVSRDLREQKRSEAALRHLNETLEQRVVARTGELAEANRRLMAEIAERERINDRMRELQLELFHAARLTAAGQLAAALAHELNQPLTAATNSINASRRLLAKDAPETIGTAREVLEEAAEQTLRAGQIVRRLRGFLAHGETEQQIESIAAMVEEASTLALIGTAALGVSVRFDFDPNATHTFADRIQIQQVLINLIRNAVEAMAETKQRNLVLQTAWRDPETVEVTVADSGPGLAQEVADHLFEPFVSTKRDGMGLGLSICRSIVEAHGGRLWSEPNPGGGTIFRFTLPAVSAGESHHVR